MGTADTANSIATSFRSACIAKGRPSAGCDKVDSAIRASLRGNLGKRVGSICRVLGECDAALATNTSCVLTADGKTAQLSECLREGVTSGTAVAGIGE